MPTATIISQGVNDTRMPCYSLIRYNDSQYYNADSTFNYSAGDTCKFVLYPGDSITTIQILEDGDILWSGSGIKVLTYTLSNNDIDISLTTNGRQIEITNIQKTYNKFVIGNTTYLDLSSDTITADKLLQGYTAHDKNGAQITGTASGGGASQTIYMGTSTPSSGIGSNGDVYILASSGGTLEVYPASFTSSSMNSTSNASKCIGVSADDGNATGNMYSSGSGTTGTVDYSFDLSGIPSTATISSVSCRVMAHEENSSRSAFTLQLYAGSTAKGSETTVSGTSNTIYTLTCGSWSRSEIDDLVLHTEYGYYGGLVAGCTLTIVYTVDFATYEVTLTGTASSWSISGDGIYQKSSGSWSLMSSVTLDDCIAKE